jgi:hypothetical protein
MKFDFTDWIVKDEQGNYGKEDRRIYLQNTRTARRLYPKYTWVGDQLRYYKDTTDVPEVLKEFIIRTTANEDTLANTTRPHYVGQQYGVNYLKDRWAGRDKQQTDEDYNL